jgi:cytochrome c-type biogenesis protein CcmF
MKDNNMSSNPDTKSYLLKDVFTYISYALNKAETPDTAQFKEHVMAHGDTAFYSNGYMVLGDVIKNPKNSKFQLAASDISLMADVTIVSKDNMHYKASPLIIVDSLGIKQMDDTVYAQNLYVRFMGVNEDQKIRIGIKESDQLIDFVTVKAYMFPMINLVWLGLVVMALGILLSMLKRGSFTKWQSISILAGGTLFIFYMFLIAG